MKTAVLAITPAPLDSPGRPCILVFTAIGLGLALVVGFAQGAVVQQNPLTAVDIALEPDATMLQHAKDAPDLREARGEIPRAYSAIALVRNVHRMSAFPLDSG
jgi:hypothetical protein